MVLHYFGGGIGHLKNAPQQVPIDPSSEEMSADEEDNNDPCTDTNKNIGTIPPQPSIDVVMFSELEVAEEDATAAADDEEDSDDGDEDGDQTDGDEDEDSGCSGDEEDYGYVSP